MNKQIHLLISRSLQLIICLVLMDLLLGGALKHLFFSQKSGKYFRINYTMEMAEASIFIFGSSHALRHYVPEVIEKEISLSCYNAGVLGQQILFQSALQTIVLERTTPVLIILDIDPNCLFEAQEQYDRLADFYPYYHKYPKILARVINKRSGLEKYFLLSKLYQYNSTIVHVIRYWLAPQKDWNGYRPLFGEIPLSAYAAQNKQESPLSSKTKKNLLDKNFVEAFEHFITNAKIKNVRLVFIVSPNVTHSDISNNASFNKIKSFADRYDIPLFEFLDHPSFIGHYSLFADFGHLNDTGAKIFSKLVAKKIRNENLLSK